ncbi:peptidoglycan DD-metalloendopeptidase family protein [Pseudomonadota bacterium]
MNKNWKFKCHLALAITLLSVGLLAGCAGWKPDEGGSKSGSSYSQTPDGYYRVKHGDTLHAIAFKFGMDWRNIAQWNDIRSPYTIYPDQDLRLSAPGTTASPNSSSTASGSGAVVTAAAPPRSSSTTTYDVPSQPRPAVMNAETATSPAAAEPVTPAENPPRAATPAPSNVGDPATWLWPADGRIISNFAPNDPSRKGIDIGGKEGEAVVASAAGEVVYSGSGLIGYGELVIIKHNEQLLSAYAHNHKRLVTEGQKVAAGQRIADMGKNDRNQPMLHFEIRLNGNPQDPLKYLPSR